MELDQMASMFRSAWKQEYEYHDLTVKKICLITDKSAEKTQQILGNVQNYLSILEPESLQWQVLGADDYHSVQEMIAFLEKDPPDLIVTYRHLWHEEKGLIYSLGVYLDMLTQATQIPLLVLPHLDDKNYDQILRPIQETMIMTDHLAGDHRLVDFGAKFTPAGGTLFLAHVEHLDDFKRYVETISKIPELDTEVAEEKIAIQLLKEPREFIDSCAARLEESQRHIKPLVTFGHAVKTYRELLKKHHIDLLVLNTKDGEQLAMHGEAYSMAVEFTMIPLLLL